MSTVGEKSCGEDSAISGKNSKTTKESYFSTGDDFYDDYSDGDEKSVEDVIDFSDLKVKGREQELQLLHDVYSHVQRRGLDNNNSPEQSRVAMIKGLSGTGKSTLVRHFIEDLNSKSALRGGPLKPFFLSGKYDEFSGADPFSAIVEAFSAFAKSLVRGDSGELERIRKSVNDALGEEASYLATVIPDLKAVIGDDLPISGSRENAWNRLKYIFQVFSNSISSKERPVILFLDDLQWCDHSSLELIESLLLDNDLRYFMFIGAYRTAEIEDGHELPKYLERIKKTQTILEVERVNMTLGELKKFIADALKLDEADRASSLAEPIHRKTGGNIFFTIQILEELQRKQVLIFSRLTFQWDWNLAEVNLDELLSDNVIQAVTSKIANKPEILQKALMIAAYTRSTVDIDTLRTLMELDGCSIDQKQFVKLLDNAVVEGLLSNTMGSKNYSFAHDRIQQAAYAMVEEGRRRDEFRYAMGHRLYQLGSSDSGELWMMFAAADHLNATNVKDAVFLIQTNLEVGEKAAAVAAYETASKYLGVAIQCLRRVNQPWISLYELTLRLHQIVADVELCQGHLEVGRAVADIVLRNAKTKDDKLPTQLALAKALGREEKHREAFLKSRESLRSRGEYPRSLVGIHTSLIKDLIYVKRYFKRHSNSEIIALPIMTDAKKDSVMGLLSCCAYQGYYCGNMVEFLAAVLKMLRITMKLGMFMQSGFAFVGYSLFCNNINDMEGAARFSSLAVDVLAKTKAKELECLQVFVVAHWLKAWNSPPAEVCSLYDRGFKSGMESGEYENALLNRTAGLHHEYVAGYPLGPIDIAYKLLMEKLDIYKIESVQVMTAEQHLSIRCLRGGFPGFEKLLEFGPVKNDGSENYQLLYGYIARLQLAVYFGNYHFAEKIMKKLSLVPDFDKGHGTNCLRLTFCSLSFSTISRITGKKSYLRKAQKFSSQLMALCKVKGMNSWHCCLLMDAHNRACGGKGGASIKASYDHAIAAAVKNGHKQDAALGSQLAAEYLLSMETLNDAVLMEARDEVVRQYLVQAREYYREWGATDLVKHLESRFAGILASEIPTADEVSAGMTSQDGTFDSMNRDSHGPCPFPELPNMIRADRDGEMKDDVSVMTGQTVRGGIKAFSNPHTGELSVVPNKKA